MKGLSLILAVILCACAAGDMGLKDIHAGIVADLPNVVHISPDQISNLDNPILLDIREADEFAVSHLEGAIQIDPNADIQTALVTIGKTEGRPVVVYCSVGRRSSLFAARAQEALMINGATQVINLENGIFGWHNAERSLINADGMTDVVHPYNGVWKRYVRRKGQTRFLPE